MNSKIKKHVQDCTNNYVFFQLRLREPSTKTTIGNIGNDFVDTIIQRLNSNPNWQDVRKITSLNFSSKTPLVIQLDDTPFLMNVGECICINDKKKNNNILLYKTHDIYFFYIDLSKNNVGVLCKLGKEHKEYKIHSAFLKLMDLVNMVETKTKTSSSIH